MHLKDRMVGSRLNILVVIMLVTATGYYIFHCFRENQRMVYELSGLKLKFKRSMFVSSKHEKNYKTSHNNEQLFAQSNRDLQMNLAKKERELLKSSALLDKEKTKLNEAYLFYIHMKDLFGITEKISNSPEKIVDSAVVNSLKDKLLVWKSDGVKHEMLKKNNTELLKKHSELSIVHGNLQKSNSKLQKINVKNFNEYSKLKEMYDKLLSKYKNVTNIYSRQVAIDTKLQKQLNDYKATSHENSTVKDTTYRGKRLQKVKRVKEPTDGKGQVNREQRNQNKNIAMKKSKILAGLSNNGSVDNGSVVINKNKNVSSMVRNYKLKEDLESVNHVNLNIRLRNNSINSNMTSPSTPTPTLVIIKRHKKYKSIRSPIKRPVRLTNDSKPLDHKTKNVSTTAITSTYTEKLKTTNQTATHSKAVDEVEEYLEKEKESHGKFDQDFDAERKFDPPHIKDNVDANGLSSLATAD